MQVSGLVRPCCDGKLLPGQTSARITVTTPRGQAGLSAPPLKPGPASLQLPHRRAACASVGAAGK